MEMEQVKVNELATEFQMKNSVVISELKKIGVWVPSPDTPVDQDIADRIRRRLQVMDDLAQQEEQKAKEQKGKQKAIPAKGRKTIKQLGKPRKAVTKIEEEEEESQTPVSPLSASLKPRKGKTSYRKIEPEEETVPQKTEVTIEDEPIIETVEAQIPAELLEQALQQPSSTDLEKQVKKSTIQPTQEKIPVKNIPVVPEHPKNAKTPPVLSKTEVASPSSPKIKEPEREVSKPKAEEPIKEEPTTDEIPDSTAPEKKLEEKSVGTVDEIREVTFSERITVKELSEKLGVKSNEIIKELFDRGLMATINHTLEKTIAQEICEAHGVIPSFVTFEEAAAEEEQIEEKLEDLTPRAPVVTVMGHVDHGKTSILDAIRNTKVASGEAGGITQHIGAYKVESKDQEIVFIDTPGHEAFTRMRSRGAEVTDIVVLVVAADDGVMPQTLEAIDHARAAKVPIIVAINKIDKPNAQSERVKKALAEVELIPEDWGGDTVTVEVSATEKTNLDLLLEMILLSTDILELKANANRSASGIVLEAKLDKGRGAVSTVLVQNGTLKVGDSFIAGSSYGKIRAMIDDRGQSTDKAGPSSAVEILGLQGLPQAGDSFQVLENISKAREIVDYRIQQTRKQELAPSSPVSLDNLYTQMDSGGLKELPIILKADAQGSIEVTQDTLEKLSTEKVRINILHKGVGAISESDVLLASASNAVVVGFNVRPERNAQDAAEHEKVDVRLYTVIYEIAEEIQSAMVGLLEPTFREVEMGRAEVRDTFRVPKFGTIAGSYVQDGTIRRNMEARLLRDNVVIYEGTIDSLRRFKEDASEVKAGYECGISISNFNDIKVGDLIDVFQREETTPDLN